MTAHARDVLHRAVTLMLVLVPLAGTVLAVRLLWQRSRAVRCMACAGGSSTSRG